MKTTIKNAIIRLLLGVFVIGTAISTYAFTQAKTELATHYWYVKNPTSGVWQSQGSVPTDPPIAACPEDDGEVCAKAFNTPQNPSEINDGTPSQETLYRAE